MGRSRKAGKVRGSDNNNMSTMDAEEDDKTIIITSSSDQVYHWMDYEKVILKRCLNSFPPETLAKSKDTLTKLTFTEYTLFKNIKRCLKAFPNLKSLHFNNIIMDAYHRFLYTNVIDAPNLTSLKLFRSTKLTNNEYFILDFFTRGANAKLLSKFHLYEDREASNVIDKRDHPNIHGEDMDENFQGGSGIFEKDSLIMARFLIKYYLTLKDLKFLGHQIRLWDPVKAKEHQVKNLKLIQVTDFTCTLNDPGQRLILGSLYQLQKLSVAMVNIGQDNLRFLMESISRNHIRLHTIRILAQVMEFRDTEKQEEFELDCKTIGRCINLKVFEVTIKSKAVRTNNLDFPPKFVVIKSVHMLPRSLQRLVLLSEMFFDDDMEQLFAQISEYDELEVIHIESTMTEFPLSTPAFKHIYKLPLIKNIILDGAPEEIQNEVEDYVQENQGNVQVSFNTNDISAK